MQLDKQFENEFKELWWNQIKKIVYDIGEKEPDSLYPLCKNPNLTFEMVTNEPLSYYHWFYTSSMNRNPNITWEIVQAHPEIKWNYRRMSKNPNITWEIIQANPDKEWDYSRLSSNPNITWDIVQANPDEEWDYRKLSKNPNITLEIVKANPNYEWDNEQLSKHLKFTLESFRQEKTNLNTVLLQLADEKLGCTDIEYINIARDIYSDRLLSYGAFDLSFEYLSINPTITWEIVQDNPEENWDYEKLSLNPNITWDIVQANLDKPWNFKNLAKNPNITFDIVKNNPQYNWNDKNPFLPYENFYANPNLTWELFVNPYIYDSHYALQNELLMEKQKFIENKCRELHQSHHRLVQKELIDTVLHPDNFHKLYDLGHLEHSYT